MTNPKDLTKQIVVLRNKMHMIIQDKNNLLDYEVLSISQELDILLNQYYHAMSDIKTIKKDQN